MATQVLHIPSKTRGTLLGSHKGMKATLVRLDNGQEQYWRNDSIKIMEDKMTSKIMIKLTGPKKNLWQVIERVFNGVEEAHAYLVEIIKFEDIKDYSKGNTTAGLSNGWTIYCNHDIKKLIELKPPVKELSDTFPFDLKQKLLKRTLKRMPESVREGEPDKVKPNKRSEGPMVKLQSLTKDPRKARVILRQLVRQKKITKPSRWEWQEGSKELEIVKDALKK